MKAERKIKKGLVQLMLNQPFFATGLLHLDIKEDPSCQTAYVMPSGVLGYNPEFVNRLTDAQVQFLLCHELLHVLFLHLLRRGGREKARWNLACDIVIDTMLQAEKFEVILPPDRGLGIDAVGKTAEEVYKILQSEENDEGDEGENGSGGGEDDEDEENKDKKSEKKGEEKKGKEKNCGDETGEKNGQNDENKGKGENKGNNKDKGYRGFDEHREEKCDAQKEKELEQRWQSVLVQAANAARQQGKLPGSLAEIIQEMLYPPIPWRILLSQFIQRSRKADYSWIHPNRRYISQGIYLPGYYEEYMKLVVAIDSSGSINTEELSLFVSALKDILESVKCEVTLLVCDAEIQLVKENINIEEIQKIEIKGRGGTDFRPVFEYIEKNNPDVDCLLYLTDGAGDFPMQAPSYPVLWCLVEECEVPFGEKILIKGDERC